MAQDTLGESRLVEVWRFTRTEPDMPWLLVNPKTNVPYTLKTGPPIPVYVARGPHLLRLQEEHAQREGAKAPAETVPEPQGEQVDMACVELRQHEDGLLYDHVHGVYGPALLVATEDMWHRVPLAIPVRRSVVPFDTVHFTKKLIRHLREPHLVDVAARKEQATTTCVICMRKLGTDWVFVLVCGHKFHAECMVGWWNACEHDTCPICRGPVWGIVP